MADYIDTPIPYIIGVPRKVYESVELERGTTWLGADTVLFDLDKRELRFEGETAELPGMLTISVLQAIRDVQQEGNVS